MSDLIDRQAAIDAVMEILDRPNHAEFLYTDEICGVLGSLPTAQPEIIRCKDCKFYGEMLPFADDRMICHAWALNFKEDFYCGLAERKEDGRFNQPKSGD